MALEGLKAAVRGRLDQRQAPLVEAIDDYLTKDYVSFSMPAHKQARSLERETVAALGLDVYRHDVGMLNGLDDIHESLQVQVRAQELAAELIGAKQCFYLVNGSTLAVQCAMTAVAGPG